MIFEYAHTHTQETHFILEQTIKCYHFHLLAADGCCFVGVFLLCFILNLMMNNNHLHAKEPKLRQYFNRIETAVVLMSIEASPNLQQKFSCIKNYKHAYETFSELLIENQCKSLNKTWVFTSNYSKKYDISNSNVPVSMHTHKSAKTTQFTGIVK